MIAPQTADTRISNRQLLRSLAQCFIVLLWIVALVGCGSSGPELATVQGNVKLDGKPIAGARVIFHPESGRVAAARTDDNGDYELHFSYGRDGALIGKHLIRITTFAEATAYQGMEPSPEAPEVFPAKFNTDSELKREIVDGSNQIDFDLQSK